MSPEPAPPSATLEPPDRRRSIGASDAPAVVGVDPWRSAADVWLEKTGRIGEILTPSPAMEAGKFLEPALLDWASAVLREPIVGRQVRVMHPDAPELTATLDAVTASGAIIEAKTAGLVGGGGPHLDAWGDAGTDAVPEHVLVQVQHQLALALAQREWLGEFPPAVCYVPALLARRGFVLYQLEPHAALGAALVAFERRFWREHVVADLAPPDVLPSLETLGRLTRTLGARVALPEPLVTAWLDARARTVVATADEDDAKRALLAELHDAEIGTSALGTVSYKLQNRRAYTVAASSFRRLTWSAAKGAPA